MQLPSSGESDWRPNEVAFPRSRVYMSHLLYYRSKEGSQKEDFPDQASQASFVPHAPLGLPFPRPPSLPQPKGSMLDRLYRGQETNKTIRTALCVFVVNLLRTTWGGLCRSGNPSAGAVTSSPADAFLRRGRENDSVCSYFLIKKLTPLRM